MPFLGIQLVDLASVPLCPLLPFSLFTRRLYTPKNFNSSSCFLNVNFSVMVTFTIGTGRPCGQNSTVGITFTPDQHLIPWTLSFCVKQIAFYNGIELHPSHCEIPQRKGILSPGIILLGLAMTFPWVCTLMLLQSCSHHNHELILIS